MHGDDWCRDGEYPENETEKKLTDALNFAIKFMRS